VAWSRVDSTSGKRWYGHSRRDRFEHPLKKRCHFPQTRYSWSSIESCTIVMCIRVYNPTSTIAFIPTRTAANCSTTSSVSWKWKSICFWTPLISDFSLQTRMDLWDWSCRNSGCGI
jgi:hypothetical protein